MDTSAEEEKVELIERLTAEYKTCQDKDRKAQIVKEVSRLLFGRA